MGAGNVKAVYALWRDLDDGPLRLLVYMALIATDGGVSPRFWGGRESLALAIGRLVPERHTDDPEEIAARRRAFKAVTRTLGALKDAGAITVVLPAAPGRNAVYALNLSSRRDPLNGTRSDEMDPAEWVPFEAEIGEDIEGDVANGSHSAGATDPTQRTNGSHSAGATDPTQRDPEEELGVLGLNEGGETAGVSAHVTGPRATAETTTPDSPPQPKRCPHGLKPKIRTDGQPSCALCRVAANRPAVYRPPPPGEEPIATVTRLDSRRTA